MFLYFLSTFQIFPSFTLIFSPISCQSFSLSLSIFLSICFHLHSRSFSPTFFSIFFSLHIFFLLFLLSPSLCLFVTSHSHSHPVFLGVFFQSSLSPHSLSVCLFLPTSFFFLFPSLPLLSIPLSFPVLSPSPYSFSLPLLML